MRDVLKSHVNYVVADTKRWEQTAAYFTDTHPAVKSFVKNAGLGFAIPYLHNGQMHDYVPDFIVRLEGEWLRQVILETKGFDPLEDVKRAAAERWVGICFCRINVSVCLRFAKAPSLNQISVKAQVLFFV